MLGVLGGTFDPIHHGHLRLALEMRAALGLDEVRLVPAARPPHRPPPVASDHDRAALLEAAVADVPGLTADLRELGRAGPSYTVLTLEELRREDPGRPLCFLLGMDAFCALDTWHRWRELPELAHLGIARRPGAPTPEGRPRALLAERQVDNPAAMGDKLAGNIAVIDIPMLDISASRVRHLLTTGVGARFLVPDPVLHLIHQRGLYGGRA